jgi:quercetin dioxygenase-like cupin family protein
MADEDCMRDYRIDFESVPWEWPMNGVRQKAVTDGGNRVRLVEYSKAMPLHWCEKGHYGYILQGRLEIELGEGIRIFEEGDGVFIPDGGQHKHRARVLSDVVRVVFVEDT